MIREFLAPLSVRQLTSDPALVGISDLAVTAGSSGPVVYAVTLPGLPGLSSLSLDAGGSLTRLDNAAVTGSAIAGGAADVTLLTVQGQTVALVTGVPGGAQSWRLPTAGDLGARSTLTDATLPGDLVQIAASSGAGLGPGGYLWGLCRDGSGIERWSLQGDGTLGGHVTLAGPGGSLGAITVAGDLLLAAGAGGGPALTSYRIRPDGGLDLVTRAPGAELGIAGPPVLETVEVGGRLYALLGAAGSGTLTVYAVGSTGGLQVADHVFDNLATRFGGIRELDAVVMDGVAYVACAGNDDGVTLFRLLPGGRLLHLASIADSTTSTLANVAALALVARDGLLQMVVTSGAEAGMTVLTFRPGPQGLALQAAPVGAALAGGAGADVLTGGVGNDALGGGAGDDILRDGAGRDQMTGGAGADVFVLDPDGQTDTILDFQPGQDLIDLSAWRFLRQSGQLQITARPDGAEIRFGTEVLRIVSADRSPLTQAELLAAGLTGMDRLLPDWSDGIEIGPEEPQDPPGVTGAGRINGGGGNDVIRASMGSDTIWGNSGDDTLFALAGNDTLYGGTGADIMNGGPGSDVYYLDDPDDRVTESGRWAGTDHVLTGVDFWLRRTHVENLTLLGTADIRGIGNGLMNTITGNDGDNILDGGKNNDRLIGRLGDDVYLLRAPGDTAVERYGEGIDTVLGFRSVLLGAHIENLYLQTMRNAAGEGVDGVNGIGNGLANTIVGNPFDNVLNGRDGNDTLRGQGGADTFVFDRPAGPANTDRIIDFDPDEDRIGLMGALFGIARGALSPGAFHLGSTARDPADRVIYDPLTDVLWVDPDGSGPRPAAIVATFANNPLLGHDDFIIF